jgi:hypothetical protein
LPNKDETTLRGTKTSRQPTDVTVLRSSVISLMEEMSQAARICADAFTKSNSESAREEVMWTVLRLVHDQHHIPLVVDAMAMIREILEKEEHHSLVITELGEKDIAANQKPREYRQRNSEFATEYKEAKSVDDLKKRF